MKTQKIMVRDFGFGTVRQNHKTGWVCLTDILTAGNILRVQKGLEPRRMDKFFVLGDTQEYLQEMARIADRQELDFMDYSKLTPSPPLESSQESSTCELAFSPKDFYESRRGRYGGTWGHPFLTIKLTSYLNKEFEIKMHAALYDGLLAARDSGGDSYRRMCDALDSAFGLKAMGDPMVYSKIGTRIQFTVLYDFKRGAWEQASEKQLKSRDDLQDKLAHVAPWAAESGASLERFLDRYLTK